MKEGKISLPSNKIFPTREGMKADRDRRRKDMVWMDMIPFVQ